MTDYCAGGGGGAGGTNFASPSATSVATTNNAQTLNGKVDITYVPQPAPAVVTGAVSSLSSTSAKLGATVNTQKLSTTYKFEYSTDAQYKAATTSAQLYPSATTVSTLTGSGSVNSVSVPVTKLLPLTTYHYRISATSGAGLATGADKTFTTTKTPPKPNLAPMAAIASGVRHGTLGHVLLDGRGSYDPDGGRILSYSWTAGSTKLAEGNRFSSDFTGPVLITLTVRDDRGGIGTARTIVEPAKHLTVTFRSAFCGGCSTLSKRVTRLIARMRGDASAATGASIAVFTDRGRSSARDRRRARALARSVRRALLRDVTPAPSHVTLHGWGSAHPVASNRSARGRAKNRRVVITLTGRRSAG